MPLMPTDSASAGRITVWECIGCGKIEGPQPCIGVCQDRKVQLVYASVHEEALAQLRRENNELTAFIQQVARVTPRDGEWERCYKALQLRARELLAVGTGSGDKP
jgi:hypothetical protein